MKIRNGFVSNSSSSSFILAVPPNYELTEEEMQLIRDELEESGEYFSHYESLALENGKTELLDERERIQRMLETGNFELQDDEEPVTDEIKNADILKGLDFLKTDGHFVINDEPYGVDAATYYAAVAIVNAIDRFCIGSVEGGADACTEVLNIMSKTYEKSEAIQLMREYFINENS